MRVVLLFIVAATLGVAAVTAQTNRAPAINLGTNRPITLPEAIQMALDHNLAIQIERCHVFVARFKRLLERERQLERPVEEKCVARLHAI